MEQNKMSVQEQERLVQLLTTKFNVDELNELTTLLKKDKCKVEILPIQNISIDRVNKYGKQQYNRGCLDLTLISFDNWKDI